MNFNVSILGYGPIPFTSAFPIDLASHYISGSKVFGATGNYGNLVIQELESPGYAAWYVVFTCKEDSIIKIDAPGPLLKIHIVLNGTIIWNFEGLDEFTVRHDEANIYYTPLLNGTGTFKKGETYIFFDLAISLERLKNLSDFFPSLEPFMKQIYNNYAGTLLPTAIPIQEKIREIITEITTFPYEHKLLYLYIQNEVQNLLFYLLVQSTSDVKELTRSLPVDIEKMHEAETIIRKNLANAPDIDFIATQLSMSKSKLRKDFKKLYGKPPISYWRNLRIQKAAELLKTTQKSVKEIAAESGFSNDSNFIVAFKEMFNNMTPEEWRNKIVIVTTLTQLNLDNFF